MAHLSVVVPIFREEAILRELYRRLREALITISEDFEIVLVEDGGGDRSWPIIGELSQEDARVKGLKLSRNFGQHYAITAGLDVCDGDWVVVMDGDLQDRPEIIPELYAKAQDGFDVVFVQRKERPESAFYQFEQRLFYRLLRSLSHGNFDPEHGNFSIVSRRVVDNFRSLNEHLRFYGAMVNWFGFPSTAIAAKHGDRLAGTPGYDFKKRLRLAAHMVLAHSERPLRLSIGVGLMMSAASLLYGFYIIVRALLGNVSVEGWASLIVSVYFVGGIVLMVLGIIGTYVGKIYNELKRRPIYVIDQAVGFAPAGTEVTKPSDVISGARRLAGQASR